MIPIRARAICKLRARYHVTISLILVALLCILVGVISFPFSLADQAGAQFNPTTEAIPHLRYYILIALSGALGGMFSIVLKFRSFRRITEMRATASVLISQACIGATTATIFALVLELGLFGPSVLRDWRTLPAEQAVPSVVLVSFFVGLIEGVFLRLVERMEGILGGRV